MKKKFSCTQLLFFTVAALFISITSLANAQLICTPDVGGVNDTTGGTNSQSDVTRLCIDETNAPISYDIHLSWDNASFSGANTGDACALFDTDSNGFINFAYCISVGAKAGGGVELEAGPLLYSCDASARDRCTNPVLISNVGISTCDLLPTYKVSVEPEDPFTGGSNYPNDTIAVCRVDASVIPLGALQINLCSFNSLQPNSNSVDCVAYLGGGFIKVEKIAYPDDSTTSSTAFNFSLTGSGDEEGNTVNVNESISVNGNDVSPNLSVPDSVPTGSYSISETVPANWKLLSSSCDDGSSSSNINHEISGIEVDSSDFVTCTFTNIELGSITIIKQATPADGTNFNFTATGSGVSNFTLKNAENQRFFKLSAGTYTITEDPNSDFALTSLSCQGDDDNGSIIDLANRKVDIDLDIGEAIICTFSNSQGGQIIVAKETLPDGDSQTFNFTGDITAALTDGNSSTALSVAAGTYTVTETAVAGWSISDITCNDGNSTGDTGTGVATYNVEVGETVTCTYTNNKNGQIIVAKETLPDGDSQTFNFTGDITAALTDGNSSTALSVAAGTYTVTETAVAGWSISDITCNDGNSTGDTGTGVATYNVEVGETVTCTYTNNKNGQIIVAKETLPDGDSQTFNFTGDITAALTDGNSSTALSVAAGTYTVTETAVAGWSISDITCNDGNSTGDTGTGVATYNVEVGETVTCTYTNNKNGQIIVAKETLPDGDSQTFNFTGDITAALTDGNSSTALSVAAGTYTVTETAVAGWSISDITCNDGNSTGDTGTGVATYNVEVGETVTCTYTNLLLNPSLDLTKTATPTTYAAVNDVISYSYEVENTGNIALAGPVTVTDDKATVSCPDVNTVGNLDTNLDPGESITCTASYSIVQGDLNSGSVTNTATASADGTDSNQDDETVTATQGPALTLVKTATPTTYAAVNDVISYSYEVENTGNIALAGPVTVTDDKATVSCPDVNTVGNLDTNLDPGESITCTASYSIVQGDLNSGSVTNTATASADGTDSNQDDETVTATQGPALTLVKTATPTTYAAVNDVISYSYEVENTGNIALAGPVTVTDDKATVSCPDVNTVGNLDTNLDPGESITCTASYSIVQGDLNSGSVTNTATASADGTDSNQGDETVTATQGPALTLVKTATPTTYAAVNDVISYSYEVENTGNIALAGPVTVTDDKATVSCPDVNTVGNLDTNLDPGESITCTASYSIVQGDLNSGSVTNTATASADGTDSNQDDETVTATQGPALTLVKTATPTTYAAVNDVISYSYEVENTGNIALAGPVTVTDDKATVSCPDVNTVGNLDTNLDPGESITCTASYSIVQGDLNSGSVTNTATASADGTDSNQDDETVTATQGPALTLVKTATPTTYAAVNDVISYSYEVENTGNIALAGPVTVTDDKATVSCPDVNTVGNLDTNLDPGESITCTASYSIVQGDLNSGSVTNTATASADGTDSNQDDETVTATQGPALTLVKTATPTTYAAVNDVISYSYEVENTGNIALAGPVTVTDDKATVSCPDVNTVGNLDTNLDPGESITCTASYSIVQGDLNSGSVTNTATASADGTDSNQDDETVTATQGPALTLVKTATPTTYAAVNDVISYSYEVENTGNIALAGPVTVTDDKATVSCPDVNTVGNLDTNLDPGESITCTASYSIVQGDLNSGSVTNTATASADGTDSSQDDETVTATQGPALTLVKTATPTTYAAVNDVISYSYEVENTGNIALAGPVTVTDDKATVSCPDVNTVGNLDTNLDPGESITCTASYSIVQGDLNSGSVTNTATASADGTDSNQDDETVTATQGPALTLVKTATPTTYAAVNDVISYSYEVENTGNIALAGPVTVTDDKATVSCPDVNTVGNLDTNLDPGESITCTASYSIVQGDLNSGSVTNTATASADGTDSNQDDETVTATQGPALTLVKTATPTTYAAVNDVISYSYEVENTGNIALAGPVTVTDDKATVSCPDVNTVGNLDTNLDPGESITCTASYSIVQGDLNSGSVTNTATASADGTDSNQDDETVTATQGPALTLVKTATPTTYAAVNDVISYSYEVENTGNIALAGPVTVTDDKATVSCPDVNTVGNLDTNLDPGESITCTASYSIVQGDLNSGSVTNTATASADGTDSNQDDETVTATQGPALTLVKTATPTTYAAVNDVISYSYEVENTGNIALAGPVTVTDDKATVSCPDVNTVGNLDTNLDPGESITCTASYSIVQGDLNSGSVTNTATASADGTDSNQDDETVTATQGPALTLVKTATPTTYAAVNDVISYSYEVENTGNIALAGPVTVTDDKATVSCPDVNTVGNLDTNLDPGESITCTASYSIVQGDLNSGSVTNTATASADGTDSNQDDETVTATQGPALTLVKTATPTTYAAVNDVISYSYEVENTGNIALAGPVTVTDDKATVSCPDVNTVGNLDTNLDPGESITCTASYSIVQGDLNSGSVTNTATASADGTDSNQDDETVTATQGPALTLVKTATPTTYAAVNDVISYSYEVENTGNIALAGPVTVTDDKATVSCPDVNTVGNLDTNLDPGESITCTASYSIVQGDLNSGSVTNTATASADGTDSNQDDETVTATQGPALTLVKTATPTTYAAVNDVISYSYEVENTGNIALAGPVTVTDDKATVSCPDVNTVGNLDTNLDPGESITCTASYSIVQGDLNSGSVTNTATASADGTDSSQDDETVTATQGPALTLVKTATPTTYAAVNDVISYSYEVENTGNIALAGPVTVTDDKATVSCPDVNTVGNLDTNLDPGESITCTASYSIVQGDLNSGSVTNTATASADGTDSNQDDETVTATQGPALTLVKTATPTTYAAVNDVISYSYEVENTGNIALAGPVTVTDDKATVSCPDVNTVGNLDTNLDPGESITCTASYSIVQGDLNSGSVTNTATASADGTDSNQDDETVTATQGPALTLVKTATPTTYAAVNDVISYSYEVENTGNIALAGPVTVTDDKATVSCPDVNTVGNLDTNLDPGESITCTASYSIVQGDLNSGSVTNTATASADGTDSNQDDETVTATQGPALTLVKTATPTTYAAVNDVISYSYEVENTGNIALAGPVTVTDDKATVSCPDVNTVGNLDTNLDPGESITCTASYSIVQGDLNSGSVTNTATASADGTDSNQDDETVTATQGPALTLVKTATPTTYAAVNDVISYSYEVENTGNIALAGPVTVTDDKATVSCPDVNTVGNLDTNLDPGESITCTASYSIVQGDLNSGSVTNTATASADGTDSNQDDETVTATQGPALTLVKTVTPSTITEAGQVISYNITTTNNGNTTLNNVIISDPLIPSLTCTSNGNNFANDGTESLPVGESVTCQGNYTTNQTDIDAGNITNTANVTATTPSGTTLTETGTATSTVTQTADIIIDKDSNDVTTLTLGDTITYSFTLTNTGNVTLNSITITDPLPNLSTITCPQTSLEPNESMMCTASYEITQADIDAGNLTNTATVSASPPSGNPITATDSETVPPDQAPNLEVIKTVTPSTITEAGQVISYNITTTNNGNTTLNNVIISDPLIPSLTCTSNGNNFANDGTESLPVGESVTCQGNYTTNQTDIDAGNITNTANVTATTPSGTTLTETGTATSTVTQTADIIIDKDSNDVTTLTLGDTITYSFTLTNTGNVTLNSITITDPLPNLSTITCPQTSLEPNESMMCTASYEITQADIDAGNLTNTATVSASPPSGNPITATDSETVPPDQAPNLEVIKTVTPSTITEAGQVISYNITTTNNGNTTLNNVIISDPLIPSLTCTSNGNNFANDGTESLPVGESVTCQGNYTTNQTDIDAGNITNTANVTATTPSGTTLTETGTATSTVTQTADIIIDKDSNDVTTLTLGDTITYSFTLTNTGNVTLNSITITDPLPNLSTITCPQTSLEPNESMMCTASYEITQADIDAGNLTNTATVSASPPSGNPITATDSETVPPDQAPNLEVIKTVTPSTITEAGQVISYNITTTNNGNTTLNNVIISDPLIPSLTCTSNGNNFANDGTESLPVGESVTCQGNYTTNQTDIDAGNITNTANVTATTPSGTTLTETGTATSTVTQTADIIIDKDSNDVTTLTLGDTITYSFTLTNTGNVTLNSITITDPLPNLSTITCPQTSLEPNESMMCTASYEITQADIDAGNLTNTATVSASPPSGNPITATDSKTVPPVQESILGVSKEVLEVTLNENTGVYTIAYSIFIKNYGNTSLNNLQISDNLDNIFSPIPYTFVEISSDDFSVNPNYDSSSNTNLLTGTDSLAVNASGTVLLTISVDSKELGSTTTFNNIAEALAKDPAGNDVRDTSTKGLDPDVGGGDPNNDNDGDPTNNTEPTPVTLEPAKEPSEIALRIEKNVLEKVYTIGENVLYTVVVTNDNQIEDLIVDITDTLPQGTSYIDGTQSISVSNAPQEVEFASQGGQLTWSDVRLPPGEKITITYELLIGINAPEKLDNRVEAKGTNDAGSAEANVQANASIKVDEEAFDLSTSVLIGRVYLDVDDDGSYDFDEDIPLPGARVVLSNGWQTVTDVGGGYMFRSVPVGTASVRLDALTAPYLPRDNYEGIGDGYLHQVSIYGLSVSDFPLIAPEGAIDAQRRTTVIFGPITLEKKLIPLPEGVRVVLHINSTEPIPYKIILLDPVPGLETKVFELEEIESEQTLTYDVPMEIPMTDPIFEWGDQ